MKITNRRNHNNTTTVQHSSSSCKGAFGVLQITGSNTLIFAVVEAWLILNIHCILNWEVYFLHWYLLTKRAISIFDNAHECLPQTLLKHSLEIKTCQSSMANRTFTHHRLWETAQDGSSFYQTAWPVRWLTVRWFDNESRHLMWLFDSGVTRVGVTRGGNWWLSPYFFIE